MAKMDISHAVDAVSSMRALRLAMTNDLDDIENSIYDLAQSGHAESASGMDELKVYCVARAALYSGLASINEVMGWIHLMAEKDPEGNSAEILQSLPTVPIPSIN